MENKTACLADQAVCGGESCLFLDKIQTGA